MQPRKTCTVRLPVMQKHEQSIPDFVWYRKVGHCFKESAESFSRNLPSWPPHTALLGSATQMSLKAGNVDFLVIDVRSMVCRHQPETDKAIEFGRHFISRHAALQ